MRTIEIDLAGGGDNTVDPRVAPQGTISRAQNLRLDRKGRLVARAGYTSMGVTVRAGFGITPAGALNPYDLHNVDGTLVALGAHDPTQTGIHYPYRFLGSPTQGNWRTESSVFISAADPQAYALPAVDNIAVVMTELNGTDSDVNVADIAVSSDGAYAAMVSVDKTFLGQQSARLTVVDCATDGVVYTGTYDLGAASEANPRILAVPSSQKFLLFTQVTTSTEIRVRTLDMALASPSHLIAATVIATGCSAFPCPYDVSQFIGTTDYLLVFATPTGYTWRRFNATHVQQTTLAVVDLANAPCSICGATGESISVINAKAAPGVNIRTFNTAGALTLGPTNIDPFASVTVTWVSVVRHSATEVYARWEFTNVGQEFENSCRVTTATHGLLQNGTRNVRAATSLCYVDGLHLAVETPAQASASQRGYAILNFSTVALGGYDMLHGTLLDGIAKRTYSAATAWYQSALVQRFGTKELYCALITQDPRDKTFRANMVRFEVNSGKRRQGLTLAGLLYLTGGNGMLVDNRLTGELGVDISPAPFNVVQQNGAGLLTLLGAYSFQVVFRYVLSNGEVTQSAPSDPIAVTLTGANNQFVFNVEAPSGLRLRGGNSEGVQAYIDVYRTEAGGSIPRLSQSRPIVITSGLYAPFQFIEQNSDTVIQSGATLYTQGADGSVSGRLPLSLASPCRFMMESGGRLYIGGLERAPMAQVSIEKRPGETQGFVNDDLFFVANPQKLTAIASSADGRRYLFGASTVRELVGEPPNAAGADATLIEPVLVEPSVGCVDWRSVAVTELGVFFQSSRAPDPKIYLIPSGGGTAQLASAGIRDTLRAFPVITSATRHEQEQLLTFTLQNTAGTDGRIVHLDLTNSGMSQNGFVGRWFVDRVPQLEGTPDIEVVEEYFATFPDVTAAATFSIPLPNGRRIGDRVVIVLNTQSSINTIPSVPTSFTQIGVALAGANTLRTTIWEMLVNTTARVTQATAASAAASRLSGVAHVWLLRNTHASQALEAVTATFTAGSSATTGTLTPTWGSARNLYLSTGSASTAFTNTTARVVRTLPTGFSRYAAQSTAEIFPQELAAASMLADGASTPGVTWATPFTINGTVTLLGIRPLASVGTPVRASSHLAGRLVVCTSTDVVKSDNTAVADFGSAFVSPELELADLYPMGAGGAGRHNSITFVGELLGYCVLNCLVSYDEGRNWTALRSYNLHSTQGFSVGQTVRLTWVPKRRKIVGVRVKLTVSENTADSPAPGDTAGVAMQRLYMQFDELVGPSRLEVGKRQ